ncbi:hypothetical protein [Nocardia noduli]|uniref:hypothetical protein n=1 Tax=Nocardia noduli TaxID=2815722 RepID=UPI001C2118FD|nr:hypothetical protein [Nocardia noduli]
MAESAHPAIERGEDRDRDPDEFAMRVDFALSTVFARALGGSEIDDELAQRIDERIGEIAQRWRDHDRLGGDWAYLVDAYADWRARPDTMARFMDRVSADRAAGYDAMSPAQLRSHHQARAMTANRHSETAALAPGELDAVLTTPSAIASADGDTTVAIDAALATEPDTPGPPAPDVSGEGLGEQDTAATPDPTEVEP